MFVMRFYGARRLVALGLAVVLTQLLSIVCGWAPPADWHEYSPAAQQAVAGLVEGIAAAVKLWWAWMALKMFAAAGRRGMRAWIARGLLGLALLRWGVPALRDLAPGCVNLAKSGGDFPRVLATTCHVALVPVALGATPLLGLALLEKLHAQPAWRRWFHDGQGHNAGFSGPEKILSVSRPLFKSPTPRGGHRINAIILGKALAEDVGDNRRLIVHAGSEHLLWLGQPSSGKHICAKPTYCTYLGDMILASNKSEQVDEVLGARVDPARMPRGSAGKAGRHGVNPAGITAVTHPLPNGQAYLLDYGGQSVYPGNKHTLLSEIDINSDHCRLFALAIADGWFPELPNVRTDPWFREAPRNALAAVICHILSVEVDPRKRTLPYCVQRLMGIDPFDRSAGPSSFTALLKAMVCNRHPKVGAFVATTAAQIIGMGERNLGTMRSTLQTNTASILDAQFAKMLTGESDFSYRQLGEGGAPVTVFHCLPRGDASLRAALPLFRAHAELSLQILQTKLNRPSIPTIFVADEARQFLSGISAIARSPMLLRDARVLLWQMYQSWPSVVETLGQGGADELEACAIIEYLSIGDQVTADKLSRRLGKYTRRDKRQGSRSSIEVDVLTPEQVLRQLNLKSNLGIIVGGGMPTMRVERLAFKDLVTREGAHFQGLPLVGQYDDRLSRYRYGEAAHGDHEQ